MATRRKPPLRAVSPEDRAPCRRPKSVTEAAEDGTTRELLVAMRSRIAKAVEDADDTHKAREQARLRSLRTRSLALDVAVILGAFGGAATCAAVLTLFVGALRDAGVAGALYGFFGLAIVCTIGALTAFLFEMLLASRFLRVVLARSETEAGS